MEYYRNVVNSYFESNSSLRQRLSYISVNFDSWNEHLPNDFSFLVPQLKQTLYSLKKDGFDHIAIPNITLHETLNKVPERELQNLCINPWKIIPDNNMSKTLIIGSRYTHLSDYPKSFCTECSTLEEEELELIDQIRVDIYKGKPNENELRLLEEILNHHSIDHQIIFACSELSIAASQFTLSNAVDLLNLQIDKVVKLLKE